VTSGGEICGRPATRRERCLALCEQHALLYEKAWLVHDAETAVHYLRQWLWIARESHNEFLEGRLLADLTAAEARRSRAYEEMEQARAAAGNSG
jgi:hypothetical protein